MCVDKMRLISIISIIIFQTIGVLSVRFKSKLPYSPSKERFTFVQFVSDLLSLCSSISVVLALTILYQYRCILRAFDTSICSNRYKYSHIHTPNLWRHFNLYSQIRVRTSSSSACLSPNAHFKRRNSIN